MSDTRPESGTVVTMYTTSTCGPCVRLKRALREQGIEYREVNVESDYEAAEWVMAVNQGARTVPTLLFPDGTTLTNPSADQVARHLAR